MQTVCFAVTVILGSKIRDFFVFSVVDLVDVAEGILRVERVAVALTDEV